MFEDGVRQGKSQKHVSTACTNCRKRKVKCDGQEPSCSNCILYKQDCTYTHGEDKRKQSSRKIIDSLTARVKILEKTLLQNGIAVPPGDGDTPIQGPVQQEFASSDSERKTASASGNLDFEPAYKSIQATSLNRSQTFGRDSTSEAPHNSQGDLHNSSDELLSSIQIGWEQYSQGISRDGKEAAYIVTPTGSTGVSFSNNLTGHDFSFPLNSFQNEDATGPFQEVQPIFSGHRQPAYKFGGRANYSSANALPYTQQRRSSIASWHDDEWVPKNHIKTPRDESSSPKEVSQDDEIVDQLAARMGSFQIAEDGQLRYFGATSNLHIVHNGQSSLFRAPTRSMRKGGEEVLRQAGLLHTIDPEIEHHLEQLYFSWEDPSIHVVDEEMYYLEQKKWKAGQDGNPFYSETLKNAILAVGAKLSSCPQLSLAQPAAEFFQSRAKALLEVEMDSPTVATVQALVVMSATEAALTRDARGWLYSGMAVRLSADLGLHLDLNDHVREGRLTAREADVRRTTFWGVFIHDNMWSLYVGRPWGITLRDVSVSRPGEENSAEGRQKIWRPVLDASDGPYLKDARGIPDPIDKCTDSNITLAEMMSRLSRTLYAGKSLSDEDLSAFAAEMREDFLDWENNLPEDLRVNLDQQEGMCLPHVLQLHMQFHAISIFLHRPLFSQTRRTHPQTIHSTSVLARQACITSAQSIVSLLQIYRRQHTLRRSNVQIVHLVFSAGLILIYNTCTSVGAEAERAMADLQVCCEALSEIGQAYKNSTRALEVIICIKREWQSKARAQQQRGKRSSSSFVAEGGGDEQRKKRTAYAGLEGQQESFLPVGSGAGVPFGLQNPWGFLDEMEFDFGINTEALGVGLSMFDPFLGGSFDFGSMSATDTQGQNGALMP